MKNFGTVLAAVLLSTSVFASGPGSHGVIRVYAASSQWSGSEAMDVNETQGIKMDAIDKALEKCVDDGNLLCAVFSTRIEGHNFRRYDSSRGVYRRYTKVKAIVQSLDEMHLGRAKTYKGDSTWRFDIQAGQLKSLGVKAGALDEALTKCFEDGNQVCAVMNVRFDGSNMRYYDTDFGFYRYKTTAQATVRGYRLD